MRYKPSAELASARRRQLVVQADSLRVKKMAGYDDVWEFTWAPDGRATFEYGPSVKDGHPHVVWRRIGTHDIFKCP